MVVEVASQEKKDLEKTLPGYSDVPLTPSAPQMVPVKSGKKCCSSKKCVVFCCALVFVLLGTTIFFAVSSSGYRHLLKRLNEKCDVYDDMDGDYPRPGSSFYRGNKVRKFVKKCFYEYDESIEIKSNDGILEISDERVSFRSECWDVVKNLMDGIIVD